MVSMARPDESIGPRPLPVLLIAADTGGGHRAAAQAISEELTRLYPGRFTPVLCDPLLSGPRPGDPPGGSVAARPGGELSGSVGAAWPLRAICGLYGPVV